MKKAMILLFVVSFTAVSISAFAAATALSSGSVTGTAGAEVQASDGQTISNLSSNVVLGATYNTATYALNTYHTSGTKAYGTAYDSTSIYFDEIGVGATLSAPSADDSTAFTTDYTEM